MSFPKKGHKDLDNDDPSNDNKWKQHRDRTDRLEDQFLKWVDSDEEDAGELNNVNNLEKNHHYRLFFGIFPYL